jgi:prolyl-tRNA editing enzyme YbaK/EbsC (Cys-tRNA(Pro) deacylase)
VKSALDVHRALLAQDVPHEMVRLRVPVSGADDLPRALGMSRDACVAVRCYRVTHRDGAEQLCAVMVRPGDTPDPGSLLEALDASSIRPATAAEVNAGTDYASALVSPICLPADVLLLADAALGSLEVLYTPTGESGVALGIHTRDLLVASRALVTNLTARPLAARESSDWHVGAGLETAGAAVLPLDRSRLAGGRRTG